MEYITQDGETYVIPEDVNDALWRDAYRIAWIGACNPIAIANAAREHTSALVKIMGTRPACKHPAVVAIVAQIAFLCGLSFGPPPEVLDQVEANAIRLGLVS